MPHASDSGEQRKAEIELVRQLSEEIGIPLKPERIDLGKGVQIVADGFNREQCILCEAYSHIGRTRGGQLHKIARDILKMLAAERHLGGKWNKFLCFADESATRCLKGRSWLAAVCNDLEIEVKVFKLPVDLHDAVVAAQLRQVMVNPS